MNKVPYIERSPMSGGLTGECAYVWAVFLAREADMADDYVAYDKYKTIADQLTPKQGIPMPSSVHYPGLEEAIERYSR